MWAIFQTGQLPKAIEIKDDTSDIDIRLPLPLHLENIPADKLHSMGLTARGQGNLKEA